MKTDYSVSCISIKPIQVKLHNSILLDSTIDTISAVAEGKSLALI